MATSNLLDPPAANARAQFADGTPRFLLTIDTEEDFDWDKPLTRDSHDTRHVPKLEKFQEFCENEGVVPVYLVVWPIANSRTAKEILREPLLAGRAGSQPPRASPWAGVGGGAVLSLVREAREQASGDDPFCGSGARCVVLAVLGCSRPICSATIPSAPTYSCRAVSRSGPLW